MNKLELVNELRIIIYTSLNVLTKKKILNRKKYNKKFH